VAIDPYRFRIIRDSWHKIDRRDAAALWLALWMSAQSRELVLPEVAATDAGDSGVAATEALAIAWSTTRRSASSWLPR